MPEMLPLPDDPVHADRHGERDDPQQHAADGPPLNKQQLPDIDGPLVNMNVDGAAAREQERGGSRTSSGERSS